MIIPGNYPTGKQSGCVNGTVIVLIVNMQSVGLSKTAEKLGEILAGEYKC